jgi:hypothetical protein
MGRMCEQRFTRKLEKQLGGDVDSALRAYQDSDGASGADLNKRRVDHGAALCQSL